MKQPIEEVTIQSLDQLNSLAREPIHVEFILGGKRAKVTVYRLTPEADAAVALVLKRALPPVVRGKDDKGGELEPRYDFDNEGYRKSMVRNQAVARALGLCLGCPFIRDAVPVHCHIDGGYDEAALLTWMGGQLTEEILETLWNAVTSSTNGDAALARALEHSSFFSNNA